MGAVRYEVSRESSPEAVYRAYWKEVAMITEGGEDATEKKLSTTLLVLPNFGLRNCESFEVSAHVSIQLLVPPLSICLVNSMPYGSIWMTAITSFLSCVLQSFSNTLTQSLEGLSVEDDIQLVFFHPQWVFRDGVSQ